MANLMTGAEMVFKVLEDQGVKHIFGYPGGAVLPIYDELKNTKGVILFGTGNLGNIVLAALKKAKINIICLTDNNKSRWGKIYNGYKKNIIPWIGEIIAQNREAYKYLEESISLFPNQKELIDNNLFNAYNHYLFQIGAQEEFSNWLELNRGEYDKFVDWYTEKQNIIEITNENKFIR